jgi:RNA polymerase sigma factor (sigma-70 family)
MTACGNFTDDELKALLLQGSEEAFDEIYSRFWKRLYNEAYKRLHNPELSEEIVQDIFIDLWTKRAQKEIDNLAAYLVTSVRYQVFIVYNKTQKLPYFEEPLEYTALSSEEADSGCFEKDLIAAVQTWLDQQPEKRREIFRLRFLEEMTTREISEHLNISQKTVQNQLNTAQDSLRSSVSKLLFLTALTGYFS